MKIAHALVALAACWSLGAVAAPPTDASIQELLKVTRSESMMENVHASMEHVMRAATADVRQREQLSPAQQKALDQFPARFAALVQEESSWAVMEPEMVAIYRDSFTQDEIDAQLAFYRTPGGQAVIAKMPMVVQKSMEMGQRQMQRLVPKMQALIEETLSDGRAVK